MATLKYWNGSDWVKVSNITLYTGATYDFMREIIENISTVNANAYMAVITAIT